VTEIVTKQGNGNNPQKEAMTPFDPMRLMRDFWRMDPFRESGIWRSFPERMADFEPSFDVKETKDSYIIKADVPGVKDKDIEVSVHGNRLQISGSRASEKEEKTDTYYTCERSSGSFMRTFTLPDDANPENIKADLSNGVLAVTLTKRAESKVKQIPVSSKH
jgi:HSP20 family protein